MLRLRIFPVGITAFLDLPDYLSADQFIDSWPQVEQIALAQVVGRRNKVENLQGLLGGVQELYENEKSLILMLTALDKEAQDYVKEVKKGSDTNGEDTEA